MEKLMQPESKFITVNGLKLHYLHWGNPRTAPMLLLHGLCSNAHYWDFFARSMEPDSQVLAVDQRGHGDSSWAESYSFREYIHDLEAFVAELELNNMVLIGHSMGGINAIIYAARHPDQVDRLVIVDIGPEIAAAGAERMQKEWANEPESFSSEEAAIQYKRQIQPRYSDAFIRHHMKHSLKHDAAGRLVFKYDKALFKTELTSPEWLWEYVEQVICPTLIVHGEESDFLLAGAAKSLGSTLAFGSVVDIEHASHSVPGDNPEAFEAAVRQFLSGGSESS
jgi:esterase